MRAGVYVRISLDRKGARAGVERQLEDCRELAEARGWDVVEVYEDNDQSAYAGKERPAYQRMQRAVGAGDLDVVIAWHTDRLWRNVGEQQAFLGVGRDGGLKLVATPTREFDPTDADDELFSTFQTAIAARESAAIARRMRRKQEEKASKGEYHGGRRPFGYDVERDEKGDPTGSGVLVLVPDEADVIRECADRVLRGEPIRAIALDLNARKIPTATGRDWRASTLSQLLGSPRIAGLRQHHNKVVGKAAWESIVDEETHQLLAARCRDRLNPQRRQRPARRNLLAGFARCGRCGAPLSGSAKARDVYRYVCPGRAEGGCSGISIRSDLIEGTVRDILVGYLDSPAFARAIKRQSKSSPDLAALVERQSKARARLLEVENRYADGDVEFDAYRRIRERIVADLETIDATIGRTSNATPAMGYAKQGQAVSDAWDAMTLDERRTVLGAVVEHFVVHPAKQPVNRYDPERVEPVWRF